MHNCVTTYFFYQKSKLVEIFFSMVKVREHQGVFYIQEVSDQFVDFLSSKYQSADPFPHIVIDDFLSPSFLEKVLEHFPKKEVAAVSHKSQRQYLKRGYRPHELKDNPCNHYINILNTAPILKFLERLTGINGLITDPYYAGGGLHESDRGGYLNVHVDFTLHKKLNLERRLNMLIFLNKDWKPEYEGNLELWDTEKKGKVVSIEPIFNRCVIFNTTHNSYHGLPVPIQCPPNRTRRSIALFYYTSIQKELQELTDNSTWANKTSRTARFFQSIFKK